MRAPTTTSRSPSRSRSCWPGYAPSHGAPPDLGGERLAAGDIVLDAVCHRVTVGDQGEDLSAKEYALLGYLIRQDGRVVTRQQILDAVWGAEPDVYSNVVDLYIHYLRRKLEALGRRDALRTVRGVGYALSADDGGSR